MLFNSMLFFVSLIPFVVKRSSTGRDCDILAC